MALGVLLAACTGCGIENEGPVLWRSDAAAQAPVGDDAAVQDAAIGSLTLTGFEPTPAQGDDGGQPYMDVCPDPQVVIGYSGYFFHDAVSEDNMPVTYVGAIRTLCGTPALGGADGRQVTIAPGQLLPLRGDARTTSWTRQCPANQSVIGFSGRDGNALDRLIFRCGAWEFAPGAAAARMVSTMTLPAAGGDEGTEFAEQRCPEGQVARGTDVRANVWLDSFALVCGTLSLAR